jgi:hypothetical protein
MPVEISISQMASFSSMPFKGVKRSIPTLECGFKVVVEVVPKNRRRRLSPLNLVWASFWL